MTTTRKLVIFTDLDGTLLDRETYDFAPARPALDALRERGVPLVLVSSKTRAEMEPLAAAIGVRGPLVVENGGAIVAPGGAVLVLGATRDRLLEELPAVAREAGVRARPFAEMSVAEVAALTGLPEEEAELAMRREYDEPFVRAARAAARAGRRRLRLHGGDGGDRRGRRGAGAAAGGVDGRAVTLLDTHTLLFLAIAPERLSRPAARAIRRAARQGGLAIASITLWEIAMLVSKGRLDPGTESATFCQLALDTRDIRVLPITPDIAMESTRIDLPHGDPADRLIAATASAHNAVLVTCDEHLRGASAVRTLW